MKPLISIIIPVYNVEKYLRRCLESLINQSLSKIEIICVNDGSKDNSLKILKEYALKDERIIVVDQQNQGVSIARNNALKYVRGEFYMFVDSDDWLDRETCEITYNYATLNHADCLMFSYTKEFGNHSVINHIFDRDYFIWDKEEVQRRLHRRLFGPIEDELSKPQDLDIMVTPCMQLFRTEKFVHIPFMDIREIGTFEDGLYQIILYKNCDRFIYIDKPYYHYLRINDSSLTTAYNPHLLCLWEKLYNYMEKYIKEWNLGDKYEQALQNRIALSVLGAGINITHSKDGLMSGGRHIKKILKNNRYRNALLQLDITAMPFPWKVFFFLAKHMMATSLFAMMKIIEYIRIHKQ